MFCTNCGKEISNDTKFCPFCGSAQGQAGRSEGAQAKPVQAPAAGKSNPTMKVLLLMAAVFFAALILFLGFAARKAKTDSGPDKEVIAATEETAAEEAGEAEEEPMPFADGIRVGDIVTFGSYEQDGRMSNGSEPIEWDVLGEQDGRYLLISHYVLDIHKFDDGRTDQSLRANEDESSTFVTWETCSLRNWLNNEFYDTAFSDTEQQYIVEVTNTTRDYDDINENDIHNLKYPGKTSDGIFMRSPNVKFTGKGGNPTQDNVFMLSFDEFVEYYDAEPYFVGGITAPRSFVSPTQYAVDQGVSYVFLEEEYALNVPSADYEREVFEKNLKGYIHQDYQDDGRLCSWVLRSPGESGSLVMVVQSASDCLVEWSMWSNVGIRPAIWVSY